MMTRGEAIERIKGIKDSAWGWHINGNVLGIDYDEFIEIMDVALTALHPVSWERVEKVWRGEWKRRDTQNGIEWFCSKCGYVSTPRYQCRDFIPFHENRPMLFCNACGAPMTDEAVQMAMERLEIVFTNEVHGE